MEGGEEKIRDASKKHFSCFMDLWRFEKVVNEIHLWEIPIMQINFYYRSHKTSNVSRKKWEWRDADRDVSIKLTHFFSVTVNDSAERCSSMASGFVFLVFHFRTNRNSMLDRPTTILLMDVQRLLIKLICALNWPTVTSNYHRIDEKTNAFAEKKWNRELLMCHLM